MFPTPVGMNRNGVGVPGDILRVPHACGDEPFLALPFIRKSGRQPEGRGGRPLPILLDALRPGSYVRGPRAQQSSGS